MFGRETHQQLNLVVIFFGSHLLQQTQIVPIHGKDQVKRIEILFAHPASTHIRDIKATLGSRRLGTTIGRLTDMKRMRACRRDFDNVFESGLANQMPEDAFGHRRPTDIAHAYEQHTGVHCHRKGFSLCHVFFRA